MHNKIIFVYACTQQQKNDENVRSLLLQHIDYNESVLSSALPKFFFTPPKLVCLDHEQLEAIRALVKGKRPCKCL